MIKSQLEILTQAQHYLEKVSTENYQTVLSPQFISCAGAHVRHILDHYFALMLGVEYRLVNYDVRSRNSAVEHTPDIAKQKIVQVIQWLKTLTDNDLSMTMTLATEVSVFEQKVCEVKTTLARELVFASSHAVHHYAMIAQITFSQTGTLPAAFGLAPATASFLRKRA